MELCCRENDLLLGFSSSSRQTPLTIFVFLKAELKHKVHNSSIRVLASGQGPCRG